MSEREREKELAGSAKLQLDKQSDVIGINPSVLAAADEEFLIFSPKTGKYLFMSKDPSFSDKLHTKVEVRENRDSKRNFFKLKKVEGKDLYNLYNIATEKYVYVSGDGVLGTNEMPEGENELCKFQFTFEPFGKTGCYKIESNDINFFVSSSSAGIPPNFVVHASKGEHDGRDVFQFVLEKKVKEAKIEYELEKAEVVTVLLEDIEKKFINDSAHEEMPMEYSLAKDYPKEQGFEFNGFSYFGDYIGGRPAKSADTGDLVAIAVSFRHSTMPSDETDTMNCTTSFKVKPGGTSVFTCTCKQIFYRGPCKIQVTTRNKKILETTGVWRGNSHIDSSILVSDKSNEKEE